MSKMAFMFPGQGSQAIGMGVALADSYAEAASLYKEAQQVLGWDLLQACKEGPEERLRQTDVAQPALYVTGYVAAAILRAHGIAPEAVAGHSIGEYAALAAAGVFSFSDGLRLVRERGRLMQAAAQARPGGMVAVLGLARPDLATLCESIQSQYGVCVPVNFNSPEQIVVAGLRPAVDAFAAQATAKGAKRVIPLNVAGAFHSPLMMEAAQAMKGELTKVAFKNAACPVAMNVDGRVRQEASDIQAALAQQLDHSVEWVKSIESLRAIGCDGFVECGSGRVLSGLLKRIDKQAQSYSTESVEATQQVLDSRHSSASHPQ